MKMIVLTSIFRDVLIYAHLNIQRRIQKIEKGMLFNYRVEHTVLKSKLNYLGSKE